MRRDPIGYRAGINLLEYVNGRAQTWMDATGLSPAFVFTSRNPDSLSVTINGLFITSAALPAFPVGIISPNAPRYFPAPSPNEPETSPEPWWDDPRRDPARNPSDWYTPGTPFNPPRPGSRGNCWRYATCRPISPAVPADGSASRPQQIDHSTTPDRSTSCAGIAATLRQNPCITQISEGSVGGNCPAQSWKVCYLASPGRDQHYVRQDPDGSWSHKPGFRSPRSTDCARPTPMPIVDPSRADWNCSNHPTLGDGPNYSFCGCFCALSCV